MKKILQIIGVLVVFPGLLWGGKKAINKDQIVRCRALLKQERDFDNFGFYVTRAERAMCDKHGISFAAGTRTAK